LTVTHIEDIKVVSRQLVGGTVLTKWLGLGAIVAVILFSAVTASGDTISYTVAGTYANDVPSNALFTPNAPFTFTFSEPVKPIPTASDVATFTTVVPISYMLSGANAFSGSGSVIFANAGAGGLFNITFDNLVFWNIAGPQIFNGPTSSPTLFAGNFSIDPLNSFVDPGAPFNFGSIQKGGTVTAKLITDEGDGEDDKAEVDEDTVAISEPGSFVLLGSGLMGVACLLGRKRLVAV
jgi:hypothetical protein